MQALREILAVFGIQVDNKELAQGEKNVESFKKTLGEFGAVLAGAFAVKEIVHFGEAILQEADALAKQAQSLSVSAAALQGWQWAAQLSGSSAEEFSGAFTKFNRNVAEAAKGTGPAAEALKLFGITAEDIKNKAPVDILDQVAGGFAGIEDPAKRTAAMMALFGKSGNRLAPLFAEGAEGVAKLRAEVEQLGAGFDESFLENAQEVNDNVDRLKLGAKGLAIQAIGPLLPMLANWTQRGVELTKGLIEMLKQSNAVKAGLVAFGTVGAVKAVNGFVQLAQKAGFLKNGLRGLMLELLPLVAAFLVLEDVWTFLTGGDSITGDLIEKFFGKDAPEKVKQFASALKDAGIADFATLLKAAFGIFTDDQPLDAKFRALIDYIEGPFLTRMKADFGAAGESVTLWLDLLTRALAVLNKIVDGVAWLGEHAIVKPIGGAIAESQDAARNDAARNERFARDNLGRIPAAADYDVSKKPFWQQAVAFVTGFKPEDAVPVEQRRNVATAALPMSMPSQQIVQQSVDSRPTIVQHITAETPDDIRRAAEEGAKKGLNESTNDRAFRALVPSPG